LQIKYIPLTSRCLPQKGKSSSSQLPFFYSLYAGSPDTSRRMGSTV
jgi:hypothetical protein